MNSACTWWVLAGQIVSVLSINSTQTHWVNAPSPPVSTHQEAREHKETYIEDGAKLHLSCAGTLEAPCCPLVTTMTMMVLTTTVRIGRPSLNNRSRSHRRTGIGHGPHVLDGGVDLRTIVDRRGRHCDRRRVCLSKQR